MTLLEIQVVVIQDDVTELDEDVTLLEGDVNFLFDETVIQDERLFSLEQATDVINAELVSVDDELEGEFLLLIACLISSSCSFIYE